MGCASCAERGPFNFRRGERRRRDRPQVCSRDAPPSHITSVDSGRHLPLRDLLFQGLSSRAPRAARGMTHLGRGAHAKRPSQPRAALSGASMVSGRSGKCVKCRARPVDGGRCNRRRSAPAPRARLAGRWPRAENPTSGQYTRASRYRHRTLTRSCPGLQQSAGCLSHQPRCKVHYSLSLSLFRALKHVTCRAFKRVTCRLNFHPGQNTWM